MKKTMMSIVLLLACGMAQATQADNTRLFFLEELLTDMRHTYGANFPAVVQVRDQIANLKAAGATVEGVTLPAPATQPSEPSLRELKYELAMLRFPYGANYPESAQALGLEQRIARLEAAGAQDADSRPLVASPSRRLLLAKVELAVEQQQLGIKNPAVQAGEPEIRVLERDGTKIDLADAKPMLAATVAYRQALLRTYPIRNPLVVAQTRRIDYLSSLVGTGEK